MLYYWAYIYRATLWRDGRKILCRLLPDERMMMMMIYWGPVNLKMVVMFIYSLKDCEILTVVQTMFPCNFHTITSLQKRLFIYYISDYYVTHSQLIYYRYFKVIHMYPRCQMAPSNVAVWQHIWMQLPVILMVNFKTSPPPLFKLCSDITW